MRGTQKIILLGVLCAFGGIALGAEIGQIRVTAVTRERDQFREQRDAAIAQRVDAEKVLAAMTATAQKASEVITASSGPTERALASLSSCVERLKSVQTQAAAERSNKAESNSDRWLEQQNIAIGQTGTFLAEQARKRAAENASSQAAK